MPRSENIGTDHQLATARRLLEMGRINVAFDEEELMQKLGELDQLKSWERIGPYASEELQSAVRDFILKGSLA